MRIGIDYRLAGKHLGGMAVYLRSLLQKLKEIDNQNEYILFDDNPTTGSGFNKSLLTIVRDHLWLQIFLPYNLWRQKINLAYFPNPAVSFFLSIPIVLTIPDVSFMHDPTMPGWIKWYLWIMYYLSAHKAKTITTFSQNSKSDIVKFFKIFSTKIQVTPLAPSNEISVPKIQKTPKIDYIVTVPGTFVPRKNIKDTILAFKKLPARIKNTYQLVIVGHSQGEDFEKIKDVVASEGLTNKVIFTGHVSDLRLSRLYSQAKIYVCSSLYEGFGLPVLEAMTCGTPVISYANSSLPEVVGGAGILVNDSTQLSKAMQQVIDNQALQNALIAKGRKQAALYSWDKTAVAFIASLPKNVN